MNAQYETKTKISGEITNEEGGDGRENGVHIENRNRFDLVGFKQTDNLEFKIKRFTIEGKGKFRRMDGDKEYNFDKAEVYFPNDLDVSIRGDVYYAKNKIITRDASISVVGYRQDKVADAMHSEVDMEKLQAEVEERIIIDPNLRLYNKGEKRICLRCRT